MGKWMLAVVFVSLFVGSACAEGPLRQGSAAAKSLNRLADVAWRVRGRALGSLVRPGMTDEQVVRLLGNGNKPLPTGGLTGGALFSWRHYDNHGLTVSFLGDRAGVLRAHSVTFRALFD
jgi:hypothetical protein